MNRTDQQILFTSLGFLAVILNDTPLDKQALRATAIAGLIESFCMSAVPEAFADKTVKNAPDVRNRMMAVIVSIIKADGDCQPHELKNHGFTPDDIAWHWPAAYALACVALNIEPKDS